jgi:outer membrane protein OmpA-like peptidoglycan-associated protein
MKKIFFLLIAANGALSAFAQAPETGTKTEKPKHSHKWFMKDSMLSRWVIDINAMGGMLTKEFTVANTNANYPNSINNNIGTLSFKNGISYGGDAQLGFFFGPKSHFGIGSGISYLHQQGDLQLDQFKVQYQATDNNGNAFRQIISANHKITEKLDVTNISIPLLLKYKKRFTQKVGVSADAGILYNVQLKNEYKTDAAFDYEAIYKFTNPPTGLPTVYDNGVNPNSTDFLITKDHYNTTHAGGDINGYFNSQNEHGYNVGLGIKPKENTGTVSYITGSVGFLFRPTFNYFLSDWCSLNLGGYFLYQPFNNNVPSDYKLTNKTGEYSSSLQSVSSGHDLSYGGNLGVRFYLGDRHPQMTITSIDQMGPFTCGLCDGTIMIHGLTAGHKVTVKYKMNGIEQNAFNGTASGDGSVEITGLCAGTYTDIVASVGSRHAMGPQVTLVDPIIKVTSQNTTNPSAIGKCDGSLTLNGLYPGQRATVYYNFNGGTQSVFNGVVGSDNTLKIDGLCEGSYSGIVVSINNCTTNGTADVTLTAPPPPPPPPAVVEPGIDPSTPILFDLGKSQIHESSLDILEEAVLELNDNKSSYIIIDGHTDDVGTPSANRILSYKRAQAVKEYLKEMGIDEKRLITVGHGEEEPIAPNASSEGRAKNRRVIMTLRHQK